MLGIEQHKEMIARLYYMLIHMVFAKNLNFNLNFNGAIEAQRINVLGAVPSINFAMSSFNQAMLVLNNFLAFTLAIQVPVVTATVPIDYSCQYHEGSFPYFKGLANSVMYI